MERPTFQSLLDETIELPFFFDNQMEFYLTTDFDSDAFNKIFNRYPLKEYPIILKENGQPLIENNDVVRDYQDIETREYNDKMYQYRLAEQLKLMGRCLDTQDDLSVEEIYELLGQCSPSIFYELENTINEILKAKYQMLSERKIYMARKVLAFTNEEKLQRDNYKKEISNKRDKLLNRRDEILLLLKDKKDAELEKELAELDIVCDEYRNILSNEINDGVKTDNGISEVYVIFELAAKYKWTPSFTIKVLNNDLTKDEETYVLLAKQKYNLDGESQSRAMSKYDKKNKDTTNK